MYFVQCHSTVKIHRFQLEKRLVLTLYVDLVIYQPILTEVRRLLQVRLQPLRIELMTIFPPSIFWFI